MISTSYFSQRKWIVLSLFLITPLGFALKFYTGPARWWPNDYGGAVAYEIFWCLAAFFFVPKKRHCTKIAITVLIITCLLETLQLYHPPLLQSIRATFLGKTLLGTTFVPWDFPHYFLGSILGWVWIRFLPAKER